MVKKQTSWAMYPEVVQELENEAPYHGLRFVPALVNKIFAQLMNGEAIKRPTKFKFTGDVNGQVTTGWRILITALNGLEQERVKRGMGTIPEVARYLLLKYVRGETVKL